MSLLGSLTDLGNTLASTDAEAGALTATEKAIEALEHAPMIVGLDAFCIVIAAIIGYIGVGVMTYGSLRAIWDFVLSTGKKEHRLPIIRMNLGKHLALGLEFLVGKDIVESIVHPTWDDLGKLGAIVLLRTIVTFFLARELKEVEEELTVEEHEMRMQQKRRKMKQ